VADLLAVYGTLMSGEDHDGRPDVERLLRSVGPCRIPGRLHDLGGRGYPGLVAAPDGDGTAVTGELYEVAEPATTLAVLDAYEEDEYERRRVRLASPPVDAWVYVYVGADPGEPIDDGDWRAFQAVRGDR
jgi:gamma-glutamylcyclotransferase (GGCT)/AIG2-like uncharacterized protein YtfP